MSRRGGWAGSTPLHNINPANPRRPLQRAREPRPRHTAPGRRGNDNGDGGRARRRSPQHALVGGGGGGFSFFVGGTLTNPEPTRPQPRAHARIAGHTGSPPPHPPHLHDRGHVSSTRLLSRGEEDRGEGRWLCGGGDGRAGQVTHSSSAPGKEAWRHPALSARTPLPL